MTKMYNVDLHTHSTFSDGILTPTQLIGRAIDKKYSVTSLTDHDTVDGLDELIEAASKKGIKVIPGIELSSYAEHEIHILGYGIKYKDDAFIKALERSKECRVERNLQLQKKLKEVGVDLFDFDFGVKNFGRVKIAKLMIQKGYVSSIDEAFNKYLGKDGIAYVKGDRLTPKDAVKTIVDNGGVAVIAHPKKLFMIGELEPLIEELKPVGLGGLECYYPGHSMGEVQLFTTYASKYHLVATGGSDYHGPDERDITCILPEETLVKLGLNINND